MGQTISSVPNMIAFAGDLRRDAKQVTTPPDLAVKLKTAAAMLESQALAKVGQTSPAVGKLLDLLA